MLVVSDASPLRYLVLINHIGLLPTLFGRVIVPPAVVDELTHANSPEIVRSFLLD